MPMFLSVKFLEYIFSNKLLLYFVYCSIFFNLQERILDVVSRWPGSAHDSTIFTQSLLYQRFLNNEFGTDCVVLGDSAYPYERFICKPLAAVNHGAPNEVQYQNSQIRGRNVVERVNGQLKKEFPVLGFKMTFRKKETAQDVIVCCVVLHNMRKLLHQTQRQPSTEAEILHQERTSQNSEVYEIEEGGNRFRVQDFLVNQYFN